MRLILISFAFFVSCGGEVKPIDPVEPSLEPGQTDDDNDGYSQEEGDCDDGDSSINPSADEIANDGIDQDCDGSDLIDEDGDGSAAEEDCDDQDPYTYPGAEERCDGKINDCDTTEVATDERDNDGDQFVACDNWLGDSSLSGGDCDDDSAEVYPGAIDHPNDGVDQDCDGLDAIDADGDGLLDSDDCDDQDAAMNDLDVDGDGHATCDGDCDDFDALRSPSALEIPADGVDQDCDGLELCREDLDGDGYGSTVEALSGSFDCLDAFIADNADDCDDTNANVFPGAVETLDDGIDQDCDGQDTLGSGVDADGDGFDDNVDCNDLDASLNLSDFDGDGLSSCAGDCDDDDANLNDADLDGDGQSSCDGDCNDFEFTLNTLDSDGDGHSTCPESLCYVLDMFDAGSDGWGGAQLIFYADGTLLSSNTLFAGDYGSETVCFNSGSFFEIEYIAGTEDSEVSYLIYDQWGLELFGDGPNPSIGSGVFSIGTLLQADCNDADAAIYPGAIEVYDDGIDQDCNGYDDAAPLDDDGDGWDETIDCDDTDPLLNLSDVDGDGWSTCDGDCDDSDPSLNADDDDFDGWSTCDGDCDDYNPAIHLNDSDGDGYTLCDDDCSDVDATLNPADADGDGVSSCDNDCDDADASIYPGAFDLVGDGIDQDCDGFDAGSGSDADGDGDDDTVDCNDFDASLNLSDVDGDGQSSCDGDCDDANPYINTFDVDGDGASSCDGDCNDLDAVLNLLDIDGDGWTACDGDCDDMDVSFNGDDLDLDGYSTCSDQICLQLVMADNYGDGWNGAVLEVFVDGLSRYETSVPINQSQWTQEVCFHSGQSLELLYVPGAFESENSYQLMDDSGAILFTDGPAPSSGVNFAFSSPSLLDCNDSDPLVNPTAIDVPDDGIDQDCDGQDATLMTVDVDGDGAANDVDCDDSDASLNLSDSDGDGQTSCDGDCDDSDPGQNTLDGDGDAATTCVSQLCFELNMADNYGDGWNGGYLSVSIDSGAPVSYQVPVNQSSALEGFCLPSGSTLSVDYTVGIYEGENSFTLTDNNGVEWLSFSGYPNEGRLLTLNNWADCDDSDPNIGPNAIDFPGDGIDQDCDGQDAVALGIDVDGDGDDALVDCDDTDATLNYQDVDGDGQTSCDGDCNDADAAISTFDVDGDGWSGCDGDCDDNDGAIHPDAIEMPVDGVDQDCNGIEICQQDNDNDGYGHALTTLSSELTCVGSGISPNADDCDDSDPTIYAGAVEIENDGIDQDCDGADQVTGVDQDGDGWTDAVDCDDTNPFLNLNDADGDGQSSCDGDCDDTSIQFNALDQDMDGQSSCDGDCNDQDPTLNDLDLDGDGWSTCDGDCDDADSSLNGDDLDGDGYDSCPSDICYLLEMSDSYGDGWNGALLQFHLDGVLFAESSGVGSFSTETLCFPSGGILTLSFVSGSFDYESSYQFSDASGVVLYSDGPSPAVGQVLSLNVPLSVDCDDSDSSAYPGAFDWPNDGIDQDCDGMDLMGVDDDGDGFLENDDCDDSDANVYPGAVEVLGDGIDQDCDGSDSVGTDADGDGFDASIDCDDSDASIYPGALEVVDGVDNDCDGVIDALSMNDVSLGDLILTEIMVNPSAVSDSKGEWVEIHNAAGDDIDLQGLIVSDNMNSFDIDESLVISAGGYLLVGAESDLSINGGAPVQFSSNWSAYLSNSGADRIVLEGPNGELDRVEFDASWPHASGISMQLGTNFYSASDNDDVINWCESISVYGAGDAGTPGQANIACP